jgi:hypothetical protein
VETCGRTKLTSLHHHCSSQVAGWRVLWVPGIWILRWNCSVLTVLVVNSNNSFNNNKWLKRLPEFLPHLSGTTNSTGLLIWIQLTLMTY